MEVTKMVDLDLYGRGFDGIFGEGSELNSKKHALLKQKAMEDFKLHIKPGDHIDYDLYGRGDPRVFGTVEGAAPDREPTLEAERARLRISPKVFVVPIKVVKKKLGAFVRKLSGNSTRNGGDGGSPRSVSVHTETPITVSKIGQNNTEGALEGESGTPSLSPISDVPLHVNETHLDDEEETNESALLNDKNLITVIESADDATESDLGEVEHEDRIDNVPRRVRSKLPSEEEPPHIEAGIVSKVIAKLNSASSFEFRQASSFVKKTSLLPLSSIAASGGTKMSSTVERNLADNACESDALSLTQSSDASAASVKSEMFAVSPSGRVDRLCSLFQEEDSPSLFQYGMGSLYSGHAPRGAEVTTTPLNRMVEEPSTSSPKGLISASVDDNQRAATVESLDKSNETKRAWAKEDAVDVASNSATPVDQPKPRNETTNAEEIIMSHVPRGLSCDSHADLEDTEQSDELKPCERTTDNNGDTSHIQQLPSNGMYGPKTSFPESDGEMRDPVVEDGAPQDVLDVETSSHSQTTSANSTEHYAVPSDGERRAPVVEDGAPEDILDVETSSQSRATLTDGTEQYAVPEDFVSVGDSSHSQTPLANSAEEDATDIGDDIIPVSTSEYGKNSASVETLDENRGSQDTVDGDNSEIMSETRTQSSSDDFNEDSNRPDAPLEAANSFSSTVFASIVKLISDPFGKTPGV